MSGSTDTHARKAPSDSKRWMNCTIALDQDDLHAEEIFLGAYRAFCDLRPYLHSIPREEWSTDEVRAEEIRGELLSAVKPIADPGERIERMNELLLALPEEDKAAISGAEGNEYTREGVRAHDFAEKVLNNQLALEDLPEEFREPVGVYIDECHRLQDLHPGLEPFIEEKAPLFYDKDSTGTVDFAVVDEDFVAVRDLKYGAGVLVSPVENPQLAIYALSLVEDLEEAGLYRFHPGTEVSIGIVQPRHHGDEPVREWVVTLADLRAFCEPIREAAARIDAKEDLVFAPSEDTCRWCPLPVKSQCAARVAALEEGLPGGGLAPSLDLLPDISGDDKETKALKKELKAMEPEERILSLDAYGEPLDIDLLVKVFRQEASISAFLSDVRTFLTALAEQGQCPEGLKMVMGRAGNRAWVDEAAAEQMLANQKIGKDERTTSKVVSVAQAEKLIGDKLNDKKPAYSPRLKTRFEELVTRSDPKPVLALADDKRVAVMTGLGALPDVEPEDIP